MAQKLLYSSRVKMSAQDSSNPYSYHSTSEAGAAGATGAGTVGGAACRRRPRTPVSCRHPTLRPQ